MNWETVEPDSLAGWIGELQSATPTPDAFELLPPNVLAEKLLTYRGGIRSIVSEVRLHNGGIDLRIDPEAYIEWAGPDLLIWMEEAAREIDERQVLVSEAFSEDDSGRASFVAASVTEEHRLAIDGIPPVGPGGRITYYRSARLMEIAFRMRSHRLFGGTWRDPRVVAAEVVAAFEGGLIEGERLRAGFGYYEASMSVPQRLIRPVFVVMVDRLHRSDGPRWRLSSVHAATDIPEIPLVAGIDQVNADSY